MKVKVLLLPVLGIVSVAPAQDKTTPPAKSDQQKTTENPNLKRSWLHDKPVLGLMAAQGGAELFDGFRTKHAERACPAGREEPFEAFFIGRHPM